MLDKDELFKFYSHPAFGCWFSGSFSYIENGFLNYRFRVFDGTIERDLEDRVDLDAELESKLWELIESDSSYIQTKYDAGWDDAGGSTILFDSGSNQKTVKINGPYDSVSLTTEEEKLLFEINRSLNQLANRLFGGVS